MFLFSLNIQQFTKTCKKILPEIELNGLDKGAIVGLPRENRLVWQMFAVMTISPFHVPVIGI